MRKVKSTFMFSLLVLGGLLVSPAVASTTDREQATRDLIAGVRVARQESEHIWPGYNFKDIPIVFHWTSGPALLFHHPALLPPHR